MSLLGLIAALKKQEVEKQMGFIFLLGGLEEWQGGLEQIGACVIQLTLLLLLILVCVHGIISHFRALFPRKRSERDV